MLKFNVENQLIKRTDSFLPVADSRNYLKAEFNTSDEWQEPITAVFGYGGCFYQVLLDGDKCCTVPWEVIKAPHFTVSLFCGDDSLITANTVDVAVEPSGMKEGTEPSEPTPEIWQQYMSEMQNKIENAVPYIGENGNWYFYNSESCKYEDSGILAAPEKGVDYFDGKDGTNGVDGKDGYTPRKGVDYWTDEDKSEIKAYVAPFVVNVEIDRDMETGGYSITSDTTYDDINAAFNNGQTVVVDILDEGGLYEFRTANVHYGGERLPIIIIAECLLTQYEIVVLDDNTWSVAIVELASKNYVNTRINYQIGDIETALDNIIAKYGLDGDAE